MTKSFLAITATQHCHVCDDPDWDSCSCLVCETCDETTHDSEAYGCNKHGVICPSCRAKNANIADDDHWEGVHWSLACMCY